MIAKVNCAQKKILSIGKHLNLQIVSLISTPILSAPSPEIPPQQINRAGSPCVAEALSIRIAIHCITLFFIFTRIIGFPKCGGSFFNHSPPIVPDLVQNILTLPDLSHHIQFKKFKIRCNNLRDLFIMNHIFNYFIFLIHICKII